jgi:hypothetical protein
MVYFLAILSKTRIDFERFCQKKPFAKANGFFQRNPPPAEEIHLRWMKSLRDEIPLRG